MQRCGGRTNPGPRARVDAGSFQDAAETAAMEFDLRWVHHVMAFLAAANFVVSALHTVLLFSN